ncbi:tyrosine-type recombinase/integrase [Aliiglaciecola sp. NS0011-25]|uniref:tyrosine-type recombinase/integrase n=1 Tax=Aliiglaciecola sp. NS0011-25 TaxID=3127654 RepID=UPI0031085EB3
MAFYSIKKVYSRGFVRYKARVRHKVKGKDLNSRSKTFDTEAEATSWASRILNSNLKTAGKRTYSNKNTLLYTNIKLKPINSKSSLNSLIDEFLTNYALSRTYKGALRQIKNYELGSLSIEQIDLKSLIRFCNDRIDNKAETSTINIDINALKFVLKTYQKINDISFDVKQYEEIRNALIDLSLISKSKERTRRLTVEEFDMLNNYFEEYSQSKKVKTPYASMFRLYILTTIRRSELISVSKESIDVENQFLKIVPNKQGKRKKDIRAVPLTKDMIKEFEIINDFYKSKGIKLKNTMPLFDIKPSTMTSVFIKAVKHLKLGDLRLHDLRAEGISRYLEQGLTVPQIAVFSNHSDFKMIESVYNRMQVSEVAKLANKLTNQKDSINELAY